MKVTIFTRFKKETEKHGIASFGLLKHIPTHTHRLWHSRKKCEIRKKATPSVKSVAFSLFNTSSRHINRDSRRVFACRTIRTVPTFTLSNFNYNFKDQLTLKNIANVNSEYLQSIGK